MTEQEVGEPRLSLDSVATAEDDEERRIAAGQAYGDAFCSKNRDVLLVVDDIHYSSMHETARGEQAAQKPDPKTSLCSLPPHYLQRQSSVQPKIMQRC
ncbi:hypothetical protein DIPPA_24187 [Diplonema papillatum]|nr:hypothetical protein DIPPA_11919 [Diplonema papillatum]KAJ9440416.1 hypothetical protein DIPPA_24187 [Diplonema papillatum]